MKISFLGTRGEIKPSSKRHKMHTSTLISFRRKRVMIDCGETWRKKVFEINPDAIVITHAHPDHAFGLDKGAPCPVWATKDTWDRISDYPIEKRHVIKERKKTTICGITFEAFPALHSIKAPAVGYRITAGKVSIFYIPDVVWIESRKAALKNIRFYIGDGATIKRNMIRKAKGTDTLIGHANIRQQITWCEKEHVPKMIVTHCGSDIVAGNEKKILKELKSHAESKNVKLEIAYDGWEITI